MDERMNLGEFDTRITIENPVVTSGSRGESITTWEEVCKAWAKVEYDLMSESNEAYTRKKEQNVTVFIRWRSGIESNARLIIEETTYYIKSVGVIGRKRFLQFEANIRK